MCFNLFKSKCLQAIIFETLFCDTMLEKPLHVAYLPLLWFLCAAVSKTMKYFPEVLSCTFYMPCHAMTSHCCLSRFVTRTNRSPLYVELETSRTVWERNSRGLREVTQCKMFPSASRNECKIIIADHSKLEIFYDRSMSHFCLSFHVNNCGSVHLPHTMQPRLVGTFLILKDNWFQDQQPR